MASTVVPVKPAYWLTHAGMAWVRHLASPVEPGAIEMAQYYWYLNCSKAARELSFKPRDPGETLHETVVYLRENFLGGNAFGK